MRNKRLFVVLAGATVFGLIAAVAVSRYLSNAQALTRNMQTVVVAKVEIPLGTKLVAEQLTSLQVPSGATPDGTFESMDKLVGRVTVVNVAAREPVTDYKLAPEGAVAGLSAMIPEGYRAMTVKVDDVVGISGFARPGTLVDVVVVINPTDNASGTGPISKIVLQNIKVLASGQDIDKPKNEREAQTVRAVTLQVTPEQAEKLALASTEGKLQLVMRNSVDQGDEQTQGVDKRTLLGGERAQPVPEPGSVKSEQPKPVAPAPAPSFMRRQRAQVSYPREETPRPAPVQQAAPPAPPRPTVEIIEGTKKRNVDFP
ncbi:MAG TPA: Flp pilus assembly protein CpaB [Pyrinomonadaceae bacterium]|jgi:pilus assembly protein CpaB|nr:Flp pilus assembly protein CpaB [Pyrinomonadaceae bacterium]